MNYLYKKKVVTIQAPDPRKGDKNGETVNAKQLEYIKDNFFRVYVKCRIQNISTTYFRSFFSVFFFLEGQY